MPTTKYDELSSDTLFNKDSITFGKKCYLLSNKSWLLHDSREKTEKDTIWYLNVKILADTVDHGVARYGNLWNFKKCEN